MAKHTPGPWETTTRTTPVRGYVASVGVKEDGFLPGTRVTKRLIADVRNKEDALLIAAAPELLEAAIDMVRGYETPQRALLAETLSAAIAKARGEAR